VLSREHLEIEGQEQYLETLKKRLEDDKSEMATIRKKMEFYNYMKEEEKVEEKRDKTNKKLAYLKQLEKQKQELNEKSRSLIQFIQVISKSMVACLYLDQLPSHVQ
jgi:small-conductance mechanosensitive channel